MAVGLGAPNTKVAVGVPLDCFDVSAVLVSATIITSFVQLKNSTTFLKIKIMSIAKKKKN